MRRLCSTVAAVVCGVALAACGGTPEASDPPTPSASSSSPSANASPTPPEMPQRASERSEEGAEAAVSWFLTSMDYAGSTGEVEEFRQTFSRDCARCAAIASGIERTYNAGGSIEGGAWTAKSFESYGIEQNVAYIDAVIDYAPQTLKASESASPSEARGARNVLHAFQLVWKDGWKVAALDPEA